MFRTVRVWVARVRSWGKARWQSWWSIIRIVPQAGPAVTVAALLNLVIGVLPLGFVVATSVAIARVPALGRSAHDSLGTRAGRDDPGHRRAVAAERPVTVPGRVHRTDQQARRRLLHQAADAVHARRGAGGPAGAGGRARQAERCPAGACRVLRHAGRGRRWPGHAHRPLRATARRGGDRGDRARPAGRAPDRRRGPGRPLRSTGVAVPLVGDHRPAVGGPPQDVLRLRHRQRAGRRQGDPRARHAALVAGPRGAGVRCLPAAAVAGAAPPLPRPVRVVQPGRARRGRRRARHPKERGRQRRAQRARPLPRDPGDPHPAPVRRVLPRGRRADAVRHARPRLHPGDRAQRRGRGEPAAIGPAATQATCRAKRSGSSR